MTADLGAKYRIVTSSPKYATLLAERDGHFDDAGRERRIASLPTESLAETWPTGWVLALVIWRSTELGTPDAEPASRDILEE